MKCRFFSKTSASSCDTEAALSTLLCTASLTGPTLTLNYFFWHACSDTCILVVY